MKTIEHYYSADLDWVENLAQQFGGKVEGNYIKVPENINTGTRYFLDCGEGIIAYYIDVKYHTDVHLIQKNLKNDFVGIYYNLTEGDASLSASSFINDIGRWKYNFAVVDGAIESDYEVKKDSTTFALCLFVKKSMLQSFALKSNIDIKDIDKITDPKKNTIIRFDRMSNESFHLLNDLRKIKAGSPVFDLNLTGTVHMLFSNFLKKMASNRIFIQTVNQTDLKKIIAAQMFLIQNVKEPFPNIHIMANMSNMSESKFKNLFRKITGLTPNAFFMENKLILGKELLESKQLSISQVSNTLNFTNSYFASKFKEHFGLSPKIFINQL